MTAARGLWAGPARRLRALEARLLDLWAEAGYEEVLPPLLLPEEEGRALVASGLWGRTLRTQAGGEGPCAIRSDFTAALALLVARRWSALEGPLRLSYAGPVLRLPEPGRNGGAELWQAGCEHVSLSAGEAEDGEWVRLAARTALTLGLEAPVLELGHWGLVGPLLDRVGWPAEARAPLEAALNRKSRPALEALAGRYGRTEVSTLLCELLHLGGAPEAIEALEAPLRAAGVWPAWQCLRATGERVAEEFPGLRVRLEPADLRRWTYYTGLTVKAFAQGHGAAVLSGGRYDGLYGALGRPFAAAGFAVSLSALMGEV